MCTHFGNIYYIPIACFVPTLDAYIMFKEAHRDRKTFWFCKCTKTWRWTHAWVCVRVCVPADRLHNQPVKSLLQAQTLQHPMTSAQCQPASLTVNLHLSLLITPPPHPISMARTNGCHDNWPYWFKCMCCWQAVNKAGRAAISLVCVCPDGRKRWIKILKNRTDNLHELSGSHPKLHRASTTCTNLQINEARERPKLLGRYENSIKGLRCLAQRFLFRRRRVTSRSPAAS